MGFRKADDFYIALGGAKISPKVVVNKVLQRLKQGEAAEEEATTAESLVSTRRQRRQPTGSSVAYGIRVEGVDDVMLRMAKCCRPVPGDPIVGYVSLGRGITIHRDDCPNTAALRKDPERFVRVHWEGDHETAFKVELQVDAWDRHRLLEDLSRTFAEAGINIVEARCIVSTADGPEPLRRRGRRHPGAQADDHAAAQHRLGVRRLPRHARRGLSRQAARRVRAAAGGSAVPVAGADVGACGRRIAGVASRRREGVGGMAATASRRAIELREPWLADRRDAST